MSERDEHEWILLRERGEDVSHVPAETRARYDRLANLIEALPDEVPTPGWKKRVFAVLDEAPPHDLAAARQRTRRRVWRSAPGLAAAAAAVIVLGLCYRVTEQRVVTRASLRSDATWVTASVPESPRQSTDLRGQGSTTLSFTASSVLDPPAGGEPLVLAEIRRSGKPHRGGDSASIGDTLVLQVKAGRPIELRVYGDTGEPLTRCNETQGCSVEHSGSVRMLRLDLVLRASGAVRAVLFIGDAIPRSFENLNADVEAAEQANVEARQVAIIHVQ